MPAQQYISTGYIEPRYYQTGLTIDWNTRVIFVPKFYLTFVSGTTYQLDTNQFRNDLKDIEDNAEGIVHPDTHRHNTEVVLSGVTYARVIEIINGYTVTFEDGLYAVNLVGSNNNIPDVLNLNRVSVRAANSAGLQIVNTSGGVGTASEVANAVWNAMQSSYLTNGTMGKAMATAGSAADPWSTDLTTYNTAGTAGKVFKDINTNTDSLESSLTSVLTNQTNIIESIGNIAVASSAIHSPSISFELTSGIVTTGTYLDTRTSDVGQHIIYDNVGNFDVNYSFDIGINAVPSEVTISAAILDKHEVINVAAWNYNTSAWEKIGEILGQTAATSYPITKFNLYPENTSKVAGQIGDVRIRFYSTAISDIQLHLDQIYVSYATIAEATGYSAHVVSATTNSIVLGSDASSVNNYYVPALLKVNHGTGMNQYAKVIGYVGSTKTLQLELPMAVTLDSTSHITLSPWANSTVIIDNAAIAEAVRTELTPELTHIMLQENGLTATQATMLTEIYALYGLDPTKPLIVTDTARTAGAGISQTINSNTTTTTVTRN